MSIYLQNGTVIVTNKLNNNIIDNEKIAFIIENRVLIYCNMKYIDQANKIIK